MGDVLVIVGALVLTTVQSIDATFRYQNYLFSMLVAVPAMLILLLRPMLSLHARLRARRQAELTAVSALIRAAPKTLGVSDIAALEALLQRRDRPSKIHLGAFNILGSDRALDEAIEKRLKLVACPSSE